MIEQATLGHSVAFLAVLTILAAVLSMLLRRPFRPLEPLVPAGLMLALLFGVRPLYMMFMPAICVHVQLKTDVPMEESSATGICYNAACFSRPSPLLCAILFDIALTKGMSKT